MSVAALLRTRLWRRGFSRLPLSVGVSRPEESSCDVGHAVKTHGLTHAALAVRDPGVILLFYQAVLGVITVYRQVDFIQAQTPGSRGRAHERSDVRASGQDDSIHSCVLTAYIARPRGAWTKDGGGNA